MAEVVLENVTKVYSKSVTALNNFSLKVRDKEFLVLLGPSGCGKSTILRLIAGLEDVTYGRIRIGSKDVTAAPPKERDIAMVFQNYALYPHMTVSKNMAFGLEVRGERKEHIEQKVNETAKMLGLGELLQRLPGALSGGQKQRVALGRAIVRQPQVFLFDEPLSNLDAKLRSDMRFELKALHQKLNSTAIYVTHDQIEAMSLGDRVVVLRDGILQQDGTPLEIYNKPANKFVASFVGVPAMNFIDGMLDERDNKICFRGKSVTISVNDNLKAHVGKNVTLGIRPEDIKVKADSDLNGLKARVLVTEPLGNEMLVYTEVDSFKLVLRVESDMRIENNSVIECSPVLEKLHFFDASTGARLNLQ